MKLSDAAIRGLKYSILTAYPVADLDQRFTLVGGDVIFPDGISKVNGNKKRSLFRQLEDCQNGYWENGIRYTDRGKYSSYEPLPENYDPRTDFVKKPEYRFEPDLPAFTKEHFEMQFKVNGRK